MLQKAVATPWFEEASSFGFEGFLFEHQILLESFEDHDCLHFLHNEYGFLSPLLHKNFLLRGICATMIPS